MIEGGISKTRFDAKLSSITSGVPGRANAFPNQNRTLSDAEQVNGDYSFADSSVSSATVGVAGRLVMYSQKLISSFGYVPTNIQLRPVYLIFHCLVDHPTPIGLRICWSSITCVKRSLPRTNKQARTWT